MLYLHTLERARREALGVNGQERRRRGPLLLDDAAERIWWPLPIVVAKQVLHYILHLRRELLVYLGGIGEETWLWWLLQLLFLLVVG